MFSKSRRAAIGTAMAAALALTGAGVVAGPVAPASAKTIKICVNKRSGEMRFLTKKKCRPGWKKVAWNKQGPQGVPGEAGAPGPQWKVVDRNGTEMGDLIGAFSAGMVPYFVVSFQGGFFTYLGDGRLVPNQTPQYRDNTCTGDAYLGTSSADSLQSYLNLVGGPARVVYRAMTPAWSTPRAYKLTSTTEAHAGVIWQRDGSGMCMAQPVYTGTLVKLQEVQAPPDGVGPLTVR